jgi:hypothetical protein
MEDTDNLIMNNISLYQGVRMQGSIYWLDAEHWLILQRSLEITEPILLNKSLN